MSNSLDSLVEHYKGLEVVSESGGGIGPILIMLAGAALAAVLAFRFFKKGREKSSSTTTTETTTSQFGVSQAAIREGYGQYYLVVSGKKQQVPNQFWTLDNDGVVRDGSGRPQKEDETNQTGWFVDYQRLQDEKAAGIDHQTDDLPNAPLSAGRRGTASALNR